MEEVKEITLNQKLAILHVTNLGFELDKLGVKYEQELQTNPMWPQHMSKISSIGGFYQIGVDLEISDGFAGDSESLSIRHPEGALKMRVRYAGSGRGCSGIFKATSPSLNYKHIASKLAMRVDILQRIKDKLNKEKRLREIRDARIKKFCEDSKGFWNDEYSSKRKISTQYILNGQTTIILKFDSLDRGLEVAETIQTSWLKKAAIQNK